MRLDWSVVAGVQDQRSGAGDLSKGLAMGLQSWRPMTKTGGQYQGCRTRGQHQDSWQENQDVAEKQPVVAQQLVTAATQMEQGITAA